MIHAFFFGFILQVCEQEKCFEPVLPLAVNLFDRFLSKCSVPKNFLQLIAADCILIASKIRQNLPVPINKLCYFTDHSVTPCQLRVSNFISILMNKLIAWDILFLCYYQKENKRIAKIDDENAFLKKWIFFYGHSFAVGMEFWQFTSVVVELDRN